MLLLLQLGYLSCLTLKCMAGVALLYVFVVFILPVPSNLIFSRNSFLFRYKPRNGLFRDTRNSAKGGLFPRNNNVNRSESFPRNFFRPGFRWQPFSKLFEVLKMYLRENMVQFFIFKPCFLTITFLLACSVKPNFFEEFFFVPLQT
jgi:hypothetical protein